MNFRRGVNVFPRAFWSTNNTRSFDGCVSDILQMCFQLLYRCTPFTMREVCFHKRSLHAGKTKLVVILSSHRFVSLFDWDKSFAMKPMGAYTECGKAIHICNQWSLQMYCHIHGFCETSQKSSEMSVLEIENYLRFNAPKISKIGSVVFEIS